MKNYKKYLLIFTAMFTLSTCFFSYQYSMPPKVTNVSLQPINEDEVMQTIPLIEPKLSTETIEITKISEIDVGGSATDIKIVGTLAYVAAGDGGFKIIDVSDPTDPEDVGQFNDGGTLMSVFISGSYAYIVGYIYGLKIIDISDANDPKKVGGLDDVGHPYKVYISGSYAYLASNYLGLQIIDISDPTNPEKVGQYYDGGETYDVYVAGSYAYVADMGDGLEIIDISDPTDPKEVGQFDDGGNACSIYIAGSYAYVGDWDDCLEIIDISNPAVPMKVGQFNDGGMGKDVFVSGSLAYLINSDKGLEIIDISDPTDLVKEAEYNAGDGMGISEVFFVEPYAYVANGLAGLLIYCIDHIQHTITITNPTISSSWAKNTSYNIFWETTGAIHVVIIDLYEDGSYITTIDPLERNNGYYKWKIPSDLINSTKYQIKIIDHVDDSVYCISEFFKISDVEDYINPFPFSIQGYNSILLLSAMGGISVILVLKRRNGN